MEQWCKSVGHDNLCAPKSKKNQHKEIVSPGILYSCRGPSKSWIFQLSFVFLRYSSVDFIISWPIRRNLKNQTYPFFYIIVRDFLNYFADLWKEFVGVFANRLWRFFSVFVIHHSVLTVPISITFGKLMVNCSGCVHCPWFVRKKWISKNHPKLVVLREESHVPCPGRFAVDIPMSAYTRWAPCYQCLKT